MTVLDNHAILTEEQLAQIVARVLDALAEEQRAKLLRWREAKRADLRAFEDVHGLPRSIPTWQESHPTSNRGGGHLKKKEP